MKGNQNKRTVTVGIFIFFGIAIFIAGILVLGAQRKTFESTITLHAVFTDVSGLQKGNNVWFSGVKVGTVKRVKLINESLVGVDLRMDKNTEEFIHHDSKAKIGSDGLIGNKILIIFGGSTAARTIKSGDTLATDLPLNTTDMMNTLQENNRNLSSITGDFKLVSRRLAEGEGTVGKLLTDDKLANQLEATSVKLQIASANIVLLASNLADYTSKFQKKGALTNDLINDTILFSRLKSAAAQIQEASDNAKELTSNLNEVSYKLKDSSNVVGVLFNDQESATRLRVALANVQSGTKKFDEDMEALQHNFLFRGFFKKRAKQQQAEQEAKQKAAQQHAKDSIQQKMAQQNPKQ